MVSILGHKHQSQIRPFSKRPDACSILPSRLGQNEFHIDRLEGKYLTIVEPKIHELLVSEADTVQSIDRYCKASYWIEFDSMKKGNVDLRLLNIF